MNKRKRKRNRIKPRSADVTRTNTPQKVNIVDIPIETLNIRAWHPDTQAQAPPEAVHVVLVLDDDMELGCRFNVPETLGFFIEELIAYRKHVWPDAEPINPDAEMEDPDGC